MFPGFMHFDLVLDSLVNLLIDQTDQIILSRFFYVVMDARSEIASHE